MFKKTLIIAVLTTACFAIAHEDEITSLATETITTEKTTASENGSNFKKRRLERNYKTLPKRNGPNLYERVETLTNNVNDKFAEIMHNIDLLRDEMKQEVAHLKDLIMAQQVETVAPIVLEPAMQEAKEEKKDLAAPAETVVEVQDVVI